MRETARLRFAEKIKAKHDDNRAYELGAMLEEALFNVSGNSTGPEYREKYRMLINVCAFFPGISHQYSRIFQPTQL